MMPVGPASSPSGVFLLSEAFSFEKAPEQVPSELPKVSETFLIRPLMLGPNISGRFNRDGTEGGLVWGIITEKNLSTGPFYASEVVGRGCAGSEGVMACDLLFDASRANSLYEGNSVQPRSIRLMPCLKI